MQRPPGQDGAAEELGGKKAAGRPPEERREVGDEFGPERCTVGPTALLLGKEGGLTEPLRLAGPQIFDFLFVKQGTPN